LGVDKSDDLGGEWSEQHRLEEKSYTNRKI
jgi:hypothetical protein